MDTSHIDIGNAKPIGGRLQGSGRPQFGQGSSSALSMKWSALHDAAATVALIAGRDAPSIEQDIRNFPVVMRGAGGWRKNVAQQGIDDISAVMEPGLSALLAAHARGADPRPAACALLKDFLAARDALLALTPPRGNLGPMRSA